LIKAGVPGEVTMKNTLDLTMPVMPMLRIRALASVALFSASLMGCGQAELASQGPSFALVDPSQRHPILVSQKPTQMSVHVPQGSSGLSPKSRADVLAFAQRSRASDAGDSRLVLQAPSGSGNEVAAMNAVQEVRSLLTEYGFAESAISVEAYDAGHNANPPVKVSYMRYVAEGPECGNWPKNLAHEPNNLPMANIGCANQRNLASMIANPADLLGPRTVSARPSERRDVIWDKYQKGETTASAKNEDGKVATRGGN
jgi:pilus assembly protein CpaD